MKIRIATDEDINKVVNWFANREWPYPPVDNGFPGFGLVSELENAQLVTCMFVYTTPTSIARLSWFGDNPEISDQALIDQGFKNMLIYFQEIQMKLQPPIRFAEVFTKDKHIVELLSELGFYIKSGFTRATYMPPRPDSESSQA